MKGKLYKKGADYVVNVKLPHSATLDLNEGRKLNISLKLEDNRYITDKQRKFIFALVNEISYHTGDDSEWVRMLMQQYNANLRDIEVESLSRCSMTYANGLIDTIINFMIEKEIPIRKDILDENTYKFEYTQVYAMALKRICVVCGSRSDLHHIDKIGMGNDRDKISHIGKRLLPLCRVHHNEIHNIGDEKFLNKYHLTPIVIDDKLEHFIKKGTLRSWKE